MTPCPGPPCPCRPLARVPLTAVTTTTTTLTSAPLLAPSGDLAPGAAAASQARPTTDAPPELCAATGSREQGTQARDASDHETTDGEVRAWVVRAWVGESHGRRQQCVSRLASYAPIFHQHHAVGELRLRLLCIRLASDHRDVAEERRARRSALCLLLLAHRTDDEALRQREAAEAGARGDPRPDWEPCGRSSCRFHVRKRSSHPSVSAAAAKCRRVAAHRASKRGADKQRIQILIFSLSQCADS